MSSGIGFSISWKRSYQTFSEYIQNGKSFSLETTLAGKNAMRQIEQAKKAGFEINLYYLGLKNVEYHIERVEMRVRNGGHHNPEEDIRRRYDRSIALLFLIIPQNLD
ncbi:zeta toxin family protein [Paenibacillus sp. 37]|uniref:zeta toxin family protein n=1 Tax=Paenibacillus sp. 37 TaxID=2607911 RepID=UPI001CB75F5C|nr:zeta toxin family protein [Paenibacillus sp. 37]